MSASTISQRQALISGAGIGGLFAAICLRLEGWQVQILEQAPALKSVGAGIQIGPNGVHLLQRAGVFAYLQESLFYPEAIEMRLGQTGQRFCYLPLGEAARNRWGAPYIHIHRADLIDGLVRRLEQLQPESLTLDAQITDVTSSDQQVEVKTADGRQFRGDILIGADGVHSFIRQTLFGADQPRFTGYTAYRAVVPAARLGDLQPPPTACIWTGAGQHAVTTRIKGGDMVNFVGISSQQDWTEESWSQTSSGDAAYAQFQDQHPTITNIIKTADQINCWALLTRPPLPRWHKGRVILLGDAAHPMLPSLAQGGVQALEDGYQLAASLSASLATYCAGLPDMPEDKDSINQAIEHAAADYFTARSARTTKVQAQSAAHVKLYHHRHIIAKLAAYLPVALASYFAPKLIYRRLDWLMRDQFPKAR